MSISKSLLIIFITGFFFFSVKAQNNTSTEYGLPFLQNYAPRDYQAGYQNYAIAQDKRGVMYFGNEVGVLVFDGKHWQIIHLSNQGQVKALKASQKGRVYVGGVDDLGYLKPNSQGILEYVSLLSKIPVQYRNFGEVLNIFTTTKGTFYVTTKAIFHLNNEKIKPLKVKQKTYWAGFQVNDKLMVQVANKGIFFLNATTQELENTSAQQIPLGEPLAAILPFQTDSYLLVTKNSRFSILKDQTIAPWEELQTNLLQNQLINFAIQLPNKQYAIGSLQIGLVIINQAGQLIKHFDKNTGLPSNSILTIFNDQKNNLWVGSNRGITYLTINAPYALVDERSGLQGQINRIAFTDQHLYIATSLNVYRRKWQRNQPFQPVGLTAGNNQNLFLLPNSLLVGHPKNLIEIKDSASTIAIPQVSTRAFASLPNNPTQVLTLAKDQILLLERKDTQWQIKKTFPGFDDKVTQLQVDASGNIWLPHVTKGIYQVRISTDTTKLMGFKLFTSEDGLPANNKNTAYRLGNELVFATTKGIYRFNKANNKFEPHPKWQKTALGVQSIEVLAEDAQGNVWFATERQTGVIKKQGTQKGVQFLPKIHKPSQILPLPNQTVAFIAQEGIVLYDAKQEQLRGKDKFQVLIYRIEEDALGKDSIFFGGNFATKEGFVAEKQAPEQVLQLPYRNNSLRISFAAPYYQNSLETTYQHVLEGFEEKWSQWSKNVEKEYTNLPEGSYTFKVKARNAEGVESVITSYEFNILAPWYRTVWAYIFYIIGIGSTLGILVGSNTRKHRRRRDELQRKIDEGTAKIQEQKEIIEASLKAETEKNNRLKSQEKVLRKHLNQLNATQKEVEQKTKMIETQKKKLEKILSEKIEQNEILQSQEEVMRTHMEELEQAQTRLTEMNKVLQKQEFGMQENMEKLIATQEQMEFTKAELDGQMAAINNSTIAKVEFNMSFEVVSANQAFCDMFGYTLAEVKGLHHKNFVDQEYAETEEYHTFLDNLKLGECLPGEYERITKDHQTIWINATYSPVLNRKKKITKIIKLAVDITQPKQLLASAQLMKEQADRNNEIISQQKKDIESALTEANDKNEMMEAQEEEMRQNMEELLATQEEIERTQLELNSQINAIENSPIIKAEFDLGGKILSANNAFLNLFYYDSDQIEDGDVFHQMLVEPMYASSFEYEFFWDNLRNGSQQPGEYKRINQQEEEMWLNATYFPAIDKRGQVFKIIMLAFDITASRQLLRDFQRQAEILRVQEEELRQNMEELVSTQEALQKESSKIESKNRLIMSSIQYAQNIQQAILPTQNRMKELFEDSLVVFIPKDIVSGDFYWTTQIRKRIKIRDKAQGEALPGFQIFTFLAVVDCTGHGVPGAFMSMIGNSLLNEIVNNQNKHNPARILQLMHEGIRTRLMQEETSNRDGMDVCLCRLEYRDDDKIELTFSGAKRPIFLVREGELKKIHGSIESIGGWLEGMQRDYENKTIELEKNDALYLTSDGFTDSANPKRKKFGEKRFRKMLIDIAHLPMSEQRQIVVKSLADHQQDTEQRDDITIVGIRV
ncbi:MAG TPA: hypothetical protein DCS93_44140 [Microscillaceae bacterium]|nr:hypothetical protein [Microscillaceae bacterium]